VAWPLRASLLLIALVGAPASAAQPERRVEAGLLFSALRLAEFDEHDFGVGLRAGYRLSSSLALEAELEHFPRELGKVPFSASRTAASLRARAGTRRDKWGVFGALSPGLARFAAAPEPLACLAVFPPPLECQLAAGRTLFALGLGGGLELLPRERLLLRLDVEDRLLRYPVAFRRDQRWQHHWRGSLGVGLRF
jgi:hypothetical protein